LARHGRSGGAIAIRFSTSEDVEDCMNLLMDHNIGRWKKWLQTSFTDDLPILRIWDCHRLSYLLLYSFTLRKITKHRKKDEAIQSKVLKLKKEITVITEIQESKTELIPYVLVDEYMKLGQSIPDALDRL